jgi:hypothetical protein
MQKGQKSIRGGIEDFLCPFTDMYITQGSNMKPTHMGIMANDVRGYSSGVRYPYYAPCTCKCLKTYPESGQVMWQSVNKVRFANGRVDYATFMTVHDDTMDAKIGQVVSQGNQLGNMGTKGNATGVHCHIEIEQGNDTSWTKNQYGVWHFNNEYDTDDCYFVDNTRILEGMGGNWKTTNQVPVQEPPKPTGADQVLYKGSKVRFDGVFKVDILKSPVSSNLFGCCQLTGCSLNDYKNENVKPYHWIPTQDFTECYNNGQPTADQVLSGGNSWVKNDNIYEVKDIDIATNSAKLNINGRDVWVFSKYLYEVSNN